MKWEVKHEDDDWADAYSVVAFDAEDAAREAAEVYWSGNDGWEWMRDGPVIFNCKLGASAPVNVVVETEFEPVFYARAISK